MLINREQLFSNIWWRINNSDFHCHGSGQYQLVFSPFRCIYTFYVVNLDSLLNEIALKLCEKSKNIIKNPDFFWWKFCVLQVPPGNRWTDAVLFGNKMFKMVKSLLTPTTPRFFPEKTGSKVCSEKKVPNLNDHIAPNFSLNLKIFCISEIANFSSFLKRCSTLL